MYYKKKKKNKSKIRGKILMDPVAQAQIENWVDICPDEISGMGTVRVAEGQGVYVDKVWLLNQEVSGSETEIDAQAIAQLLDQLDDDDADRLKFWWHSHVNMGVFWSGTDDAAFRQLVGDNFIAGIVYNKKREMLGRIDINSGPMPVTLDNVDIQIAPLDPAFEDTFKQHVVEMAEEDPYKAMELYHEIMQKGGPMAALRQSQYDFCKEEYDAKVTRRTHAVIKHSGFARGGYYSKRRRAPYNFAAHGPFAPDMVGVLPYQRKYKNQLRDRKFCSKILREMADTSRASWMTVLKKYGVKNMEKGKVKAFLDFYTTDDDVNCPYDVEKIMIFAEGYDIDKKAEKRLKEAQTATEQEDILAEFMPEMHIDDLVAAIILWEGDSND